LLKISRKKQRFLLFFFFIGIIWLMLKRYFTRKIIIWSLILAILLVISIAWFAHSSNNQGMVKVISGTITEAVVVTGKTEAVENIQMSFDRTGRVALASVKVGDHVFSGEILASLDTSDLKAELEQAVASVEVKQSRLSELNKGVISGGLDISSAKVVGAESDLNSAKVSLRQSLIDAYTKTDDAIRNLTDQFFDNPNTVNAYYNLGEVTADEQIDFSFLRRDLENRLIAWNNRVNILTTQSDLMAEYNLSLDNLFRARIFLDKISRAVNSLTPNITNSAIVLSGYRTNVASARAEVNTAISNLQSAKKDVSLAQNNLDLVLTTPEELAIGEAEVKQALAQVDQIRAQINKNMIVSPISGIITRQDAKVGETANPGIKVITVMSDGKFEISTNVPEVDVGKIALGNKVKITLDAYQGEVWAGEVSYVELAETVVDGVVNYKVRVTFTKDDSRLKSGLTANLIIETIRKDSVLILPQYAIVEKANGSFVERSLSNSQTEEVAVKTGIRSQDGQVEIISGVKEGDEVQGAGLKK
jgi:HlyD family secretion protein